MKFWQAVPYMELEQLLDVARIAEEVGFESVMGADHALYPRALHSPYPYTSNGEEAGRADTPFEAVIPLTTPPDYDTFRRLEDEGMTAGVSYPFSFIFERDSSVDEKRRYLENFAEQFIHKLSN